MLFPAVPYHGGILRIQCNANHTDEAIEGLVAAFARLKQALRLPTETGRASDVSVLARLVQKGQSYLLGRAAG